MKVLRPAHFVKNTLDTLKSSALELIGSIDGTVESILNFAKRLAEDKQNLSKTLWRRLVQSIGWGKGAVASYVKLGLAFMDVDVTKLSLVEPRTLFIITNSKKYRAVVDKIKSFAGLVTQQFVEYEMAQCRKQQASTKQEEKPTIWRAQKGGGARSCVIPPIYETDSFVGTRVQEALDKGELPQTYIRKAVALVEAMESGAIEFKKELLPPHIAEILGINLDAESREVVEALGVEVVQSSELVYVVEIASDLSSTPDKSVIDEAVPSGFEVDLSSTPDKSGFDEVVSRKTEVVEFEQLKDELIEIENKRPLIDLLPSMSGSCIGLTVIVSNVVKDVRKSLADVYRSVKGKIGEITSGPNGGVAFVRFDFGVSLVDVDWLEVVG